MVLAFFFLVVSFKSFENSFKKRIESDIKLYLNEVIIITGEQRAATASYKLCVGLWMS